MHRASMYDDNKWKEPYILEMEMEHHAFSGHETNTLETRLSLAPLSESCTEKHALQQNVKQKATLVSKPPSRN